MKPALVGAVLSLLFLASGTAHASIRSWLRSLCGSRITENVVEERFDWRTSLEKQAFETARHVVLADEATLQSAFEACARDAGATTDQLHIAVDFLGRFPWSFPQPVALLEQFAQHPLLSRQPYGLASFTKNPFFVDAHFPGGIEGFLNGVVDRANDAIFVNDVPPLAVILQDLAETAALRPALLPMVVRIFRRVLGQPTLDGNGYFWAAVMFDDLVERWSAARLGRFPSNVAIDLLDAFLARLELSFATPGPYVTRVQREILPSVSKKLSLAR